MYRQMLLTFSELGKVLCDVSFKSKICLNVFVTQKDQFNQNVVLCFFFIYDIKKEKISVILITELT